VRAAEISLDSISVLVVVSRVRNMTRLVARVKILPSEADSDLERIVETLRHNPPNGIVMKQSTKEPIAFGINAIIGDFMLEDAEGEMDKLEDSIKSIPGVGEIEVLYVSRQSVSIK
jgi:elongation factor 1-beta